MVLWWREWSLGTELERDLKEATQEALARRPTSLSTSVRNRFLLATSVLLSPQRYSRVSHVVFSDHPFSRLEDSCLIFDESARVGVGPCVALRLRSVSDEARDDGLVIVAVHLPSGTDRSGRRMHILRDVFSRVGDARGNVIVVGDLNAKDDEIRDACKELRLQEAVRLGFRRAVVPKGCGLGKGEASLNLELHEAGSITEALVLALGVNPADQEA